MGSDATSSATMPRLVANTQMVCPATMPSAVNTPPPRPPTIVLRTTSAVSGPGVTMTKIEMLMNASRDVSIVVLQKVWCFAPPRGSGDPVACSWIPVCARMCGDQILKIALPGFADEIDAERVMRLFGDPFESGLGVNAARRQKIALRPQRHAPISGLSRKAQAFVDEALAQAQPARLRIDDEQTELRDLVGLLHHEDRADALAVLLGNPAALLPGIEVLDELCGDPGDQRLVAGVPAVFLRIERGIRGCDPAHVAGVMRPQQQHRRARIGLGLQQALDRGHRGGEALLLRCAQTLEHG